ncbi:MAG: hypothetical protein WBV94_13855 [Blastocatellia bacterium]
MTTRRIDPEPAERQFPRDPLAKTMADLVTPKQMVAIRAIANSQGVNAEAECLEMLKCRPYELSRGGGERLHRSFEIAFTR